MYVKFDDIQKKIYDPIKKKLEISKPLNTQKIDTLPLKPYNFRIK